MTLNSQIGYIPVNKSGDTMTGLLVLSGDPVSALGAATKQYVDAFVAGFDFKDACYAGTTANLTATYNNWASGVGATLTNSGAMAAFSTDGVSPPINSRILVKNQSTTYENGIYTLTTVGSGAVNWVLTRATDFDTPTEIPAGAFTLTLNGSTLANHWWAQTATVTTIGTDPITFVDLTPSAGANTALSNLAAVAINTTLVSDTDNTDDLGSGTVRWANIYSLTHRTGTTATDTLKLQARDVDGAVWTDFITLTAANTPTCAIAGATITGGTVSSLATDLAVADGGTGLSSATAYAVICGGTTSTNPFQSIASVGTAGQALVSNGAGALPTFQTVSGLGGSFTFLGSATASASATIDFANLLSATYDNYLIVAEGVLPATNAITTQCRVGTGAGPTYQTTSYSTSGWGYSGAGGFTGGSGAMDLNLASRTSNTASRVGGGQVWIKNVNASTDKIINTSWQNWDSTSGIDNISMISGRWQSSTVLTSFRFLMSSGNISSGVYKLYGIANA